MYCSVLNQYNNKRTPSLSFKVFSQPIISKAKAQLLKTHFLPLMEKLKKVCLVILLFIINCFVVHQNIGGLGSNVLKDFTSSLSI